MSAVKELMRQMGAPLEDGYNTLPPRCHRWMMDISQSEETRAYGWALWRTVDYDPKGRTGPKKTKRTPQGWDERGWLGIKHLSNDLGMSVANGTDAVRRNVEKGRMRVTEEGRISVCGDAPLPQRIAGPTGGEENAKENEVFFCTENFPPSLIVSFQSLDPKRLAQYRRLYSKIPNAFSDYLKGLEPDARSSHTWEYLQAAEYKEQLEADAIKAARAAGDQFLDQIVQRAGFDDPEQRGRKPKPRALIAKLTIVVAPDEFSVQKKTGNFVQKLEPIVYGTENPVVQKSASLLSSSEFSESSELAGSPPEENESKDAELASSSSVENELEVAILEAVHRSRLPSLKGKSLDPRTVSNIRTHLERLSEVRQVKEILDVLEDKCRHLAQHPREAEEKTWGWIVGLVKGEVNGRVGEEPDPRDQIRDLAAAKRMR